MNVIEKYTEFDGSLVVVWKLSTNWPDIWRRYLWAVGVRGAWVPDKTPTSQIPYVQNTSGYAITLRQAKNDALDSIVKQPGKEELYYAYLSGNPYHR